MEKYVQASSSWVLLSLRHRLMISFICFRSSQKLEYVGIYLGKAAEIPMTLLWIPVSRASPLLRVSGIPFERAVKYHIWLGSSCIWLLIAHGVVFFGYYPMIHDVSGVLLSTLEFVLVFKLVILLTVSLLATHATVDFGSSSPNNSSPSDMEHVLTRGYAFDISSCGRGRQEASRSSPVSFLLQLVC